MLVAAIARRASWGCSGLFVCAVKHGVLLKILFVHGLQSDEGALIRAWRFFATQLHPRRHEDQHLLSSLREQLVMDVFSYFARLVFLMVVHLMPPTRGME